MKSDIENAMRSGIEAAVIEEPLKDQRNLFPLQEVHGTKFATKEIDNFDCTGVECFSQHLLNARVGPVFFVFLVLFHCGAEIGRAGKRETFENHHILQAALAVKAIELESESVAIVDVEELCDVLFVQRNDVDVVAHLLLVRFTVSNANHLIWQTMSDSFHLFAFLFENELFTLLFCQPFMQSWLAAALSYTRIAPQIISVLLFVATSYYKEFYLFLFGIGLFIDFLVNIALNLVLPGDVRVETCMPRFGSAVSYQVQHVNFFITFILGYSLLYRPRIALWQVFLLVLFPAFVVMGAEFLNYYHSTAIVAGALIGATNAMLYQLFLYWAIVPRFPWLLACGPIRWWGYQDKLCGVPTAID